MSPSYSGLLEVRRISQSINSAKKKNRNKYIQPETFLNLIIERRSALWELLLVSGSKIPAKKILAKFPKVTLQSFREFLFNLEASALEEVWNEFHFLFFFLPTPLPSPPPLSHPSTSFALVLRVRLAGARYVSRHYGANPSVTPFRSLREKFGVSREKLLILSESLRSPRQGVLHSFNVSRDAAVAKC